MPEVEGDKPEKKRFRPYPIGYGQIDIAQVGTEEGKLSLFVATGRTSEFAFVRLVESAGKMGAAQFLRDPVAAVPYRTHIVPTDTGIQFTSRKRDVRDSGHIFDRVCAEHDIEHRLTQVNHPWTRGQVGRMSRTTEDATVKRDHSDSHDRLGDRLRLVGEAYNHARRLKTLARPHTLRGPPPEGETGRPASAAGLAHRRSTGQANPASDERPPRCRQIMTSSAAC